VTTPFSVVGVDDVDVVDVVDVDDDGVGGRVRKVVFAMVEDASIIRVIMATHFLTTFLEITSNEQASLSLWNVEGTNDVGCVRVWR
jgi:hypothetical protein